MPYRTVANAVSTVPPTEYMDKIFDMDIPTLKFIPVDAESVSLIVFSLHVWKASGSRPVPKRKQCTSLTHFCSISVLPVLFWRVKALAKSNNIAPVY